MPPLGTISRALFLFYLYFIELLLYRISCVENNNNNNNCLKKLPQSSCNRPCNCSKVRCRSSRRSIAGADEPSSGEQRCDDGSRQSTQVRVTAATGRGRRFAAVDRRIAVNCTCRHTRVCYRYEAAGPANFIVQHAAATGERPPVFIHRFVDSKWRIHEMGLGQPGHPHRHWM